jgi:hypothetical protein
MDESQVGDLRPTVFIDGEPHEATGPAMTGAQLLALAGLDADQVALRAAGHRGRRIPEEEPVPVQDGSRFETVPRRAFLE